MSRIALALALLAFTTTAHAEQPAKPVEVVNDPLFVEVINAPGVQDVAVVNQPAVLDVNVVSAPPPPAVCPNPKRFQLVGFTDSTFGGAAGLIAFAAACQTEVDPDSRLCSSVEVMETVHFPKRSGSTHPKRQ